MGTPESDGAAITAQPTTAEAPGNVTDGQSMAARAIGKLTHVVAIARGGPEQTDASGPPLSPYEHAFNTAAAIGRIATEIARLAAEPLSTEAAHRKTELLAAARHGASQLLELSSHAANRFPHDPEDPSTSANVFAVACHACATLVRAGQTGLATLVSSADPELKKSIEALMRKGQK